MARVRTTRARDKDAAETVELFHEASAAPATCMRAGGVPVGEIAALRDGARLFCISGGTWSFAELIQPFLDATGAASDVVIASWTCGKEEAALLGRLLYSGQIGRLRIIVDRSWPTRKPEFCAPLVRAVGADAIRLSRSHAKVCAARSVSGGVTMFAHGSMNLNPNPRCETVCIERGTDVAVWGFDQWWSIAESIKGGTHPDNGAIEELLRGLGVSQEALRMSDDDIDSVFQ